MRAVLPWLVGAGLVAGFWHPLLQGAGFIGGDVYNYFMPLKTWYAEGLKAGEIRFWHPKIGNGVSVLGESQTGVFFPAHLIAYRFLDVIPAYNAVFLLHTLLAFVFFVWLARSYALSLPASLLGAGVFTFGWFAPRACLEWSATTGCWLPLEILLAKWWLDTGHRRWGWLLASVLTVQLSAGHYQLAWVSLVCIGLFAIVQCWTVERSPQREQGLQHDAGETLACAAGSFAAGRRAMRIAALLGFLLAGVLWAAPQLLPTWELKSLSKRSEAGFVEEVSYGRIPPKYLVQLVWPLVYDDPDRWLKWAGGDSNRIEAHFAVGSAPLLLLAFGVIFRDLDRNQRRWAILTALGLLLATGLPFAILKHVPGFSFFRYPGRYSLIAALFGSLIVAGSLDRLVVRNAARIVAALLIGGLAFAEFYWSSRAVGYAVMQNPPILSRVKDSEVFKHLTSNDRILAPDGNTLALGPAACVRPYIGLEPALYFELWNDVPDLFKTPVPASDALTKKLQNAGVTHILTEKPLMEGWPVTLLWSGYDPFLHPRWGRNPAEPLWLYRFDASFGRMWVEPLEMLEPKPTNLEFGGSKVTIPIRDPARAETFKPLGFKVRHNQIEIQLPPLPNGGRLRTTEWRTLGWSAFLNSERTPLWTGAGKDRNPTESFVAIDILRTDKPTTVSFQYKPIAFHRGLIASIVALAICIVVEWRARQSL
jgi:hypothetical protein